MLLQVAFHAQLAADEGAWDVDDVAQGIVEKLIRRHPHVFGDVEVAGADEVLVNWERIKARGEGREAARGRHPSRPCPRSRARRRCSAGPRGGGSSGVRPVRRSRRSRRRSASSSRTPDADNAEEEIGDVLFATVAVARKLGVDPESALRRTIRGFAERYERFNELLEERGLELDDLPEDEIRALFRSARS